MNPFEPGSFKGRAIRLILCIALPLMVYLGCFNYTEPTEIGIARNMVSGSLWSQEGGGLHLTWPWVAVARIDTRPMRVSVQSTGRGFSAKLARFESSHWREFVDTEGFRYYWWGNRLSFNCGYDEEYRGMRDIMRGYAYGSRSYPFVVVLKEYEVQ